MPRFGELESAIMDQVWAADGPVRVRDVLIELRRGTRRSLAHTTVQTVMAILLRKGWLSRDRDSRAWRYSATAPREVYTARPMTEALATATDPGAALALFAQRLAPDEADELRRVLDAVHSRSGEGE